MAKRKLTDKQLEELRAAYESWNPHDPESETAAELAARFGISKQTMYTYREQWLAERRQARHAGAPHNGDETQAAIRFLVEELMAARAQIAELERQLEQQHTNDRPTAGV